MSQRADAAEDPHHVLRIVRLGQTYPVPEHNRDWPSMARRVYKPVATVTRNRRAAKLPASLVFAIATANMTGSAAAPRIAHAAKLAPREWHRAASLAGCKKPAPQATR
jgi:hypothetical protein